MEYDLRKRAKLRCMHLLERRDYTEKQLREKLEKGRTEYSQDIIDEAIAYVKSYHYVDDRRFAQQYVECMQTRKSRRQIAQELSVKGISRELIHEVFEETESVDEDELIRRWMEKRHYDPEAADMKERQRMYGFLARKGFQSDAIFRMLKEEK
ncbi:MAG: regulatory protein RecX [Eubacteriales bacterium]|nr:regulatory protein RecX [Eubacteriales bacterium]